MMTLADILLINEINLIEKFGHKDENPRPKYKDGTPAYTYSINHSLRVYNLSKNEFPICTLRPIAWKSAIKEILWIYKDQSSDLRLLNNKYGIKYWDDWESKKNPGTIGIRYGATIKKYDLFNKLIEGIKNDPYSRRHIIDLWQENDFKESDGLNPCAFLTIWNVRGEYLDMCLIQRSGDMLVASGAGQVNEVQYAALLMMVASVTNYKPGRFTHFVANEQIYDRHFENAKELKNRFNNISKKNIMNESKPMLKINKKDDISKFSIEDFDMENYNPIKQQLKFDLGI